MIIIRYIIDMNIYSAIRKYSLGNNLAVTALNEQTLN